MGFTPSIGESTDILLFKEKAGFEPQPASSILESTACVSVVAGDFDNDMDVDLYLVCAGTIQNLPNRLYENDGNGSFSIVHNTGGAAGSLEGKGNQVAMADFDNDGFLDLFVTNGAGPPA